MSDNTTFEVYCKNFGFQNYPFNSFTAESEKEKQSALFVSTKLYSPLVEAFKAGQTMILSGDRGTGKTSITYDFARNTDAAYLICKIDDFSTLKINYSEVDFYRFVIEKIVNEFFSSVSNLKSAGKYLSEEDKVLLTYYYLHFASDATRGLTKRIAAKIQISKVKRAWTAVYNFCRAPLNIGANAGVGLIADVVARATGAQNVTQQAVEYFPEIVNGLEIEFPKTDSTLEALRRLARIVKSVGFKNLVIVFDKIDEDARFENAAEEISEFLAPILTNTRFLLDDLFQVVVSTWIVPLNFIQDRVRTQKIHSPVILWEHDDLRRAYDRRVEVFSGHEAVKFQDVFETSVTDEAKRNLLDLSNGNPRDLWHLMDKIFRAQYNIEASSQKISLAACERGMSDFVKQFNFYEYYPRKANSRTNSMDIYAYIKHLLKLDSPTFTRNQLNDKAGTGSSTINYTVGMVNLGLIEKAESEKGENNYRIRDPKVRFAIANKIEISKQL